MGEVGRRRLHNFKANRRGYWSLCIFLVLFVLTLFAELVANDKPLLVRYDGDFLFPVFRAYPETRYGGFFETEAEYRDPEVRALIGEKGWMVWPPVPFSYDTVSYDLPTPAPSPPTAQNWAIGCSADKQSGDGYWESFGQPVRPRSLYVAQLRDRLGPAAAANISRASSPSTRASTANIR